MSADRHHRNPVIPGFHPDPSVCRVGDDYYLVCSSFEYFPGVPIFHSRDLVNWPQIGNVARPARASCDLPPDTPPSGGIYAPDPAPPRRPLLADHHQRQPAAAPRRHRTDPAGPWSDPVYVDLPGIDPDLAWDDDGTCWCTVAGVEPYRIDPRPGEVLEGPSPLWSGTGGAVPRGAAPLPHRRLVVPAARRGRHRHAATRVSIARGRSPARPVRARARQPDPDPPQHRPPDPEHRPRRPGPGPRRQLVDGAAGRPAPGPRPPCHVLGRETFLAPVRWVGRLAGRRARSRSHAAPRARAWPRRPGRAGTGRLRRRPRWRPSGSRRAAARRAPGR